jgi:hypothetical protein
MPFDYNEFSKGVGKAREAKVSDDDILSHLASIDQGFKDAKENGYSLDEIDSFLKEKYKTKGGENNNAYQTSQDNQGGDGDRNAQEGQAVQVQAGSPEGVQANVQPSSQDQQVVQRSEQANLKITSPLTGESNLGIGGEPLEKQEQMSVGSGYKGPQAEVQQTIPSEGKAGEQAEVAPKPAPFPAVRSQGEDASLVSRLVDMPTRGLAEGVYNIGAAISDMDASFGPNILMAKAADYLFGTNAFSDQLRNAPKEAAATFRKWASSMKETPTEEKSLFNGIIYGTGKMIPDLLMAAATDGGSEAPEAAKMISGSSIWKDIADKSMHGIKSFALPSVIASQEAITNAKQQGKTDADALKDGIRTLVSTEAGAILPLGVTSKLDTLIGRAASKFVQAYGLVTAQNEIATMANNIGIEQEKRQPTITENIITGKFGDAAKQAAGAVPMALLGVLGGADEFTPGVGKKRKDLDGVTDILNQFNLPETAETFKEIKTAEKPAPKFSTRETLIYNANRRFEELSKKRDNGSELTSEESEELGVLEKVPTVEELASHYGITIQESKKKPAKAKAEAQPEKPSEEQVKEASGVSTEQGKSPVEVTAVKAEEGTPQREGEGKKEVTSFAEASTTEEVDAFLKKTLKEFEAVESIAAPGIKNKNALLNQVRKAAFSRKKEIKAEQKAAAKAEAAIPKPSEKAIIESTKTNIEKPKEPLSLFDVTTVEEVDAWKKRRLEQNKNSGANSQEKASNSKRINMQAWNRKKELAKEPKPSEKAVTEAPAPEQEPAPEDAPTEQGEPKARKPRKEKPSEPMGTRVLSAAFRPNKGKNKGKVFYGASHKQAMLKSGMSWMEIQKDYAHPEQREGLEFGYKTDTKPFVSRDKAEQVARLSGQADVAKLDADKANGYKMHSNHLSLDDHPETQGVDQKFGPGAMKKAEKGVPFGEKDHNDDLVKSAKIHKDLAKGDFKGGTNYSAWSKAFEKAFENSKNYSEDERFNLFKQGESLAAHSEFFKKDPEQSVKFPKMWSGKSVEDIYNESEDRSTQDIRFTNKAIDDEREARGLDPIMKQAAIASGEHWDEAMEQINSREGYAAAFVNSLKRNVRVLSPVETSILRHSVAESMAKRDSAAGRLSRETDPRIIKRLSREYDDAQRDYAEISELYSRTNSEAGRALGFLRMLVKADYSLPTLITKARAAKRRGGKGDANLTKEERDGLAKISEDIDKAEKDFVDSLEAQKLKENKLGLIQYLEFSSKLISTLEGEKKDAKSELNRYSSMFKNSGQDAISMGLAVRGMARNLSQILRTKNEDKILDAVHDRISNIMGDTWGKDQTLDILNGNGVFFHTTEEGIKTPLRGVKERSDAFNKQFANALKKSQAKREFILSKMLERFSIEVHNLEAQINGHMDDVAIDADRIIGELDNDLLSCE